MTTPARRTAHFLVGALAASAASIAAAETGATVDVQSRPAERRVDVIADGRPFTSYVWPERLAKPVLYPIRSAKGTLVTRGFPLDPRSRERVDHPHQVGFWFNFGDVNGVDFWGNSEAIKPEERAKMGTIRHREVVSARGGAGRGELEVLLDWTLPGSPVSLEERTRFVFHAGPGRRAIDRLATLVARGGRAVFQDTKEGMLGLRVARALEQPADKPEVFTDGSGKPTAVPVLDNTGVTGLYTSSEGAKGDAVWGTRARWMALGGRVDGEDVVLLLLDHPRNPGHPTYWHARGYGLFAANPFGAKAFTDGKAAPSAFPIEAGASAAFRHRLVVLPGPLDPARAEAEWKAFAAEAGK
ncbi:MAG TPA: PmoA family protein [Vicinamibacteria bacterium]